MLPSSASSSDLAFESDDDASRDNDERFARRSIQLVQSRSQGIKSLNVFTTTHFSAVQVLRLNQNGIEDLTPLVAVARTLRLLDVSSNQVAQLPSGEAFWGRFRCLSLVFLSGNALRSWKAIEGLQACRQLAWLILRGNPFMASQDARAFVVEKLPVLKALDDEVCTDQERLPSAHVTASFFTSRSTQLSTIGLEMPDVFRDDQAAMRYVFTTEAAINSIYARLSPVVWIQRVYRGYHSRRDRFPRFLRVRHGVVRIQKLVRGYLFRKHLRRGFEEIVSAQGQQHLLSGPTDSPLFSDEARPGLRRLLVLVRAWRVKHRIKKQNVAVKKIRFWCQLVFQRYRTRTAQVLRGEQVALVYFTPAYEDELIALALSVARRDAVLMSVPAQERERLLHERCVCSGVCMLRGVTATNRASANSLESTAISERPATATPAQIGAGTIPALLRRLHRDVPQDDQVFVSEKQQLQRDIAWLGQQKLELERGLETSRSEAAYAESRVALVRLGQLEVELAKRLQISSRRILRIFTERQQQSRTQHKRPPCLCRIAVRPRGSSPLAWEMDKFRRLSRAPAIQQGRPCYTKMHVFIPWSIDMFLQMAMALGNATKSIGDAFALPYVRMRSMCAAVTIQAAWRRTRAHSRRNQLEVAILRALVCIQRWWRFRVGLHRRLSFLRAALLLAASINSNVLFLEQTLFHLVSMPELWSRTSASLRQCPEQRLHCVLTGEHVEVVLSPAQAILAAASRERIHPRIKTETAGLHRCGFFPSWMPGTPEQWEETMTSRTMDATPLVLTDHVTMEPISLAEVMQQVIATPEERLAHGENPFNAFALCRQVMQTSAQVIQLIKRIAPAMQRGWKVDTSTSVFESTRIVRLTFASADEARKRALVLLAKTFDPITSTFVRLYSSEALITSCFGHHAWGLERAMVLEEARGLTEERLQMLGAEIPSRWLLHVQATLPAIAAVAAEAATTMANSFLPASNQTVMSDYGYRMCSPRCPNAGHPPGPAELHLAECQVQPSKTNDFGIQPAPPTKPPSRRSTERESTRQAKLRNRFGKPLSSSQEEQLAQQQLQRDYRTRDLREEEERAMEALIVDRRMCQRERAAMVAGMRLESAVQDQRQRYERELARLDMQAQIRETHRHDRSHRLTRQFENSFVVLSGALTRRAAREQLERRQSKQDEARAASAASIQQRDEDALQRRQDAKSFEFVSNQCKRQQVARTLEAMAVRSEIADTRRVQRIQQRIREDKDIKHLLHLL